MKSVSSVLFLLYFCGEICTAARIFGMFPTPSISHQVVFNALMGELSKRGHQVVVVTPNPTQHTELEYKNLKQIDVHNVSYSLWKKAVQYFSPNKDYSGFNSALPINKALLEICDEQLKHPEIKRMIEDNNEKFDVCFFEPIVKSVYAFSDRFNCSIILFSSYGGTLHGHESMGNPTHPVLYPSVISVCSGIHCNFMERINEVFNHMRLRHLHYWALLPLFDELVRKHFGPNVRSVREIENNADLFFLSGDPIITGIRPMTPSCVHIGTIHLAPSEPLPQNLQTIIDNSQHGVILFSLGSNIKSSEMSLVGRNAFLDAFRELRYTVIWKWEDDSLPDKPENVHVFNWLPQADLLNHPKVLAFITQGGFQSVSEAIHFKVPMLMMPIFADQRTNVETVMKFEIGISIKITEIDKERISAAVTEIIKNPKYRENIIRLSHLMNDQPQKPMERAVWWTEYVIRNKGAKHLRSPSADVPFYIDLLLDVLVFFIACSFSIIVIVCCICKKMIKLFANGKMKSKTS